jgi:hypothetical protein
MIEISWVVKRSKSEKTKSQCGVCMLWQMHRKKKRESVCVCMRWDVGGEWHTQEGVYVSVNMYFCS